MSSDARSRVRPRDPNSRCVLAVTLLSLVGCSDTPALPPPAAVDRPAQHASAPPPGANAFPPYFTIILTREYGMWKYRSCSLDVNLFPRDTPAKLVCETLDGSAWRSTRTLDARNADRVRQLAKAADLYGAGHVGRDLTPTDGVFETLRFRPASGGRAVVLVTSGNDGFASPGARHDLLQLLKNVEADLSKNLS